jgi:hypothetical protein
LKIRLADNVKWPNPFSTDFSFWESIQRTNPFDLAKSNTGSVGILFSRLSVADFLHNSEYLKGIQRHSNDLTVNAQACLIIDSNLTVYFMELAGVRCNSPVAYVTDSK